MSTYQTVDGLPGIALAEWQSGTLFGAHMTQRDLRFAERLRHRPRAARLDVQPAEGGVGVTTTGAVGLVRFTGFEIRIDPKLPGDHLRLFELVEFAGGLDGLVQVSGSPRVRDSGASLLDLVVEVLSLETERILAGGLRADYVEREDPLPALRGRLLVDRQQLERFGLYDRVICRYDEHEHDIADNQLLTLALAYGARVATVPRIRRRARALAAALEDLCDPYALDLALGPSGFAYSRHNEHYRRAHALSWMLLAECGPDEAMRTGEPQLRSFLIDMNALFERFLERVMRMVLEPAGVNIAAQRSNSIFWRPEGNTPYARVRPDLLAHDASSPSTRLPIDAKYKSYDTRKVDVADLTQVFLYAYAYRRPGGVEARPKAMLVHPTEVAGDPRRTRVEVRSIAERAIDAELTVVGLHIPTLLDAAAAGGGSCFDALRSMSLALLT